MSSDPYVRRAAVEAIGQHAGGESSAASSPRCWPTMMNGCCAARWRPRATSNSKRLETSSSRCCRATIRRRGPLLFAGLRSCGMTRCSHVSSRSSGATRLTSSGRRPRGRCARVSQKAGPGSFSTCGERTLSLGTAFGRARSRRYTRAPSWHPSWLDSVRTPMGTSAMLRGAHSGRVRAVADGGRRVGQCYVVPADAMRAPLGFLSPKSDNKLVGCQHGGAT